MNLLGSDTPQDPAENGEITLDDVNFALDKLEALGTGMSWIVDLFFYNIPGGRATEMPTEGLTDVTLLEGDSIRSLLVDFQSASTESEK